MAIRRRTVHSERRDGTRESGVQTASLEVQVLREKIEDSYYKLTSQVDQIRAYVFDVVRSTVPKVCYRSCAMCQQWGCQRMAAADGCVQHQV